MNQNYKKAIQYEYGFEGKKDYNLAYTHYVKALQEGVFEARDKVKYTNFSKFHLLLIILTVFTGALIDFIAPYPFLGIMLISSTNILISLYFKRKYWIKSGYANIINNVILYSLAIILLPVSVIMPYLRGVTWIPVVALFTISFFLAFASLVIYIIDKNKNIIKLFVIGIYLFTLTIISFNIDTSDMKFVFRQIEGGIEIVDYRSSDNTLSIPDQISGYKVLGIGSNAFRNIQFEEITLSDNLEYIGNNAFSGNRKLKKIVIPNGITLGNSIFADNFNLEEVTLPSDLEVIPSRAFYNNLKLKEIELPMTLKAIGNEAFKDSRLTEVTIPSELTYFGNDVFSGTKIKELVFPETLTTLGSLSNMRELTSFNIPNNITTLPNNFLRGNSSLDNFNVPIQIETIGSYAFANTNLTDVKLHDGITHIGDGIFYRAKGISEVSLPNLITYIPQMTFAYSSVKTFNITSNIKRIQTAAFLEAAELTNLTINDGLQIIGDEAFRNTLSLNEVILPDSIISLGSSAFHGSGLHSVKLPSELNEIAPSLFQDARNLKEINLPNSIIKIESNAFRNTQLTNIVLPNELVTIGDGAFYGNTELLTIDFNEALKSIGVFAFGNNTKLEIINLPVNLVTIGDFAFESNLAVSELHINSKLLNVGYHAFKMNDFAVIYLDDLDLIENWNNLFNPNNLEIVERES